MPDRPSSPPVIRVAWWAASKTSTQRAKVTISKGSPVSRNRKGPISAAAAAAAAAAIRASTTGSVHPARDSQPAT